jgi:outer membrane protein TolC
VTGILLALLPKAPAQAPPSPPVPATPDAGLRPLPINLPTALQLAHANALDIAAASERVRIAAAQLDQVNVLWLPSIQLGVDYFRHDGKIQSVEGDVIGTSKSSFLAGLGPQAVFAVSDAIYGPLAARQVLRARQADVQTAANDTLLSVAEAYFNVQQARGELAGARETTRRTAELARRAAKLSEGLISPVEAVRAEAELVQRQQAELVAAERWRVASADLARVLRLDAGSVIEPVDPPHLRVDLLPLDGSVDDLIAVGLLNRPELASQRALVEATLQRLRQEQLRPLIPSVLLRGAATNPAGTLSSGVFGGGRNDTLTNFGMRNDLDLQLIWQLDNLGFGNRARVEQRRGEKQLALIDLFRLQDRVAAEVSQAFAQAQLAARRIPLAEAGVRLSLDSADKNLAGLSQTQRAGDLVLLVVRPQEALASVQALAQAYFDYYGAVADANRAQFRLYRALGRPAQLLLQAPADPSAPCAAPLPASLPSPLCPPSSPVSSSPSR